jgi:tRNA(Ser,Leu) C12 N-acetylase TAN1
VRKSTGPILTFDPHKQKEMYERRRKEILGPDWVASSSCAPTVGYMSLVSDPTIPQNMLEKLSTLREFLRSFIELIKYETTLSELCEMIDHCAQERKIPTTHTVVN